MSHEILRETMESVMLTIDVEKAGDVAVVHCGGRLVRGAEVCHAEECGGFGKNHANRGARPFASWSLWMAAD